MIDVLLWAILVLGLLAMCFSCEIQALKKSRRAAKSASGATAASGVEMRAKGPFKADEAKAGSESGGATVGGGDPDTKDSSMPMPALMGTSRHVPDEALVDRDETGAPSKDPFVLRLSSRRLQPPDPPSCNHFMCWCKLVSVLFGSYLLLLMGFRGWVGAFQVDLVFSPLAADECVDACGVADTDSTCCSYSPLLPEGITREELTITGGSSFAIDAWLMESAPDAPRPLVPVLYAHAADGNIASAGRVSRYKWLLEQGVVLLAFDYPGYGKSDFRPSEAVVYFSATMAHDYLQRELNRRATAAAAAAQGGGIAEANAAAEAAATAGYMMGFGRGLGGNVLVRLSAAREFDALVLQSVPNSVAESLSHDFPLAGWLIASALASRFDANSAAKNYTGCVFQSQVTGESPVTAASAELLRDAMPASSEDCSVWMEVDAAFDDPMGDDEAAALAEFVAARRAQLLDAVAV